MPMAFTRMSIRPKRARTRVTSGLTWLSELRSAARAVHGLARAPRRLADSRERRLIVVDEDDPGPFLREALRDRRAHHAGGTGHHRHPVQKLGALFAVGGA